MAHDRQLSVLASPTSGQNHEPLPFDEVDYPVVANPEPEELLRTASLLNARWSRIVLELFDPPDDPTLDFFLWGVPPVPPLQS
jgi:hypothetical protein